VKLIEAEQVKATVVRAECFFRVLGFVCGVNLIEAEQAKPDTLCMRLHRHGRQG
jgi:hypothetical protein